MFSFKWWKLGQDMSYKLYLPKCDFFTKEVKKSNFNYDSIEFPYFPSRVDSVTPLGIVSLSTFLNSHKKPKKDLVAVFNSIEQATKAGDNKEKARLKQSKLYYFTPTVLLKRRCYEGIIGFNPLMVVEYDHVEDKAEWLKKAIFNRFKSCICAYTSPSRDGVKFLFRTPEIKSVDEYKEYYCGLAFYLSKIKGFDPININCTQPLFISYDYDMLIRPPEEVEEWTIRGYREDTFIEGKGEIRDDFEPTDEERGKIFKIVDRVFEKIEEEQTAHRHVRGISLSIGGYVSAGYLSYDEGIEYLTEKIETSEYCRKGTSGYLKTMRDMLNKGLSSPIYLEE